MIRWVVLETNISTGSHHQNFFYIVGYCADDAVSRRLLCWWWFSSRRAGRWMTDRVSEPRCRNSYNRTVWLWFDDITKLKFFIAIGSLYRPSSSLLTRSNYRLYNLETRNVWFVITTATTRSDHLACWVKRWKLSLILLSHHYDYRAVFSSARCLLTYNCGLSFYSIHSSIKSVTQLFSQSQSVNI